MSTMLLPLLAFVFGTLLISAGAMLFMPRRASAMTTSAIARPTRLSSSLRSMGIPARTLCRTRAHRRSSADAPSDPIARATSIQIFDSSRSRRRMSGWMLVASRVRLSRIAAA